MTVFLDLTYRHSYLTDERTTRSTRNIDRLYTGHQRAGDPKKVTNSSRGLPRLICDRCEDLKKKRKGTAERHKEQLRASIKFQVSRLADVKLAP